MWMGVPVLTLPGRSFAARVCGSLLRAAGLEEMICTTPEDYVARAIAFGRDPAQLAPFKQRLKSTRDTCLLFDTPQLIARLEDLYRQMWQDFEAGNLPRPDLSNLDIYHEIGIGLDLEGTEALNEEDYCATYRGKLAERDEFFPVREDHRLWQGVA